MRLTEKQINKARSSISAIRRKCLECTCNQVNEVRFCPVRSCPLYTHRFGKTPTSEDIQGLFNSLTDNEQEAYIKALFPKLAKMEQEIEDN